MEITYISHSSFLIEWEACYWLFDYEKGEIPEMNSEKKIFVFASHKHEDHFNPIIFRLSDKYQNITYVLSADINPSSKKYSRSGAVPMDKILSVKASDQYEMLDGSDNKIILKTLKSTDCGVAFLLEYREKTIYHAGDLNLWVWKEESKQYNNNMTANFYKEMDCLKNISIDVAFAPLDPRQQEWYYMGLDGLINTAKIRYVFPMHFWNQPAIIQQYKSERAKNANQTEIMDILREGQKWTIEL